MTMHRELNPQLFGNQSQVERIGQPVDPSRPASGIMGKATDGRSEAAGRAAVPYGPQEIKALEHQVATLKVALMQMDKRTDSLNGKTEELSKQVHGRLERFSQAIIRLEETQNLNNQEATGRFAQITAKVNERKVTDNKIQELIDRHNMVIRNFENRLLSLQRVVSEQEMALHNATAALEEARAELSKLRR